MNASDDGYGVTTGYTYGYYRRLSPSWLRLMATIHSVPFPEGEPFRYFELGYGQGVSLNVHAATNPGEYWGTDYNPEHVEFARRMAEASGAPVHLLDLSFEELAERDDLPQFQVIVAHGIWSWISDSSRAAILRFVDKHLAPGGLLYLSYNALPGAASGIAVQRLIRTLLSSTDSSLTEIDRFAAVIGRLRELELAPEGHFANIPNAKKRLTRILGKISPYTLHEYTVANWEPMLLTDVASVLHQINLQFIGTAELDTRNAEKSLTHISSEDRKNSKYAPPKVDAIVEVLRDFETDCEFRSDIFVRDPIQLSRDRKFFDLKDLRFALLVHPDEILIEKDVKNCSLYYDILNKFNIHPRGVASAADIASTLNTADPLEIMRIILCCAIAGALHPATDYSLHPNVEYSEQLNHFFASDSGQSLDQLISASPVIGACAARLVPNHELGPIDEDGKPAQNIFASPAGFIDRPSGAGTAISKLKLLRAYNNKRHMAQNLAIV